ncbi:MAG: hypothetical protein IPJ85_03500 [Flavobacteriales bacterium]|nr:hypothetical protein [Flavobacteriales bacterium]
MAAKLSPDLNGTITIPNGTAPIVTRLRMRRFAFGTGLGGGAPCGIAPFGQVHDYTVEICGAMQGTTSITDNCGTGTFSIGVNVSALGTGPNPQIGYSVNGGGTQYLNAPATGPYTLDNGGLGFAQTDVVLVTLENGSPCLTTIGNHYGNCPITINCPSVYNLPQAHCYRASDPRTWEFISSDALQTVRLTFSQGCLDAGDNIIFRQFNGGPQILATPVISGPADLTGQVITSDGQTLFVEIVSDLVGNCFDGACTTPWLFSVQCTPDCEPPSASAGSVIQNCGTNTYQVPITINSTEDGSPVDVEWLINGISSGTVSVGVGSTENIPAAGVPFGSTLNVNVLHASNDLCDLSNVGGTFNPASTCPPANDDCANATVIPVLPSGGCLWTNANVYTTANATYSSPATTCGTGGVSPVIRDVWLTFNVGATQAPLYMYYEAGTVTGLQMELYTGTGCGDLTPLAGGCLAAQDLVLNTPPAGLSYYIRFISNSTTGVPGTFRYCVTGSPTCGGNPTGNAPTLAQITGNSAQINWTVPAAGNWILSTAQQPPSWFPARVQQAAPTAKWQLPLSRVRRLPSSPAA